MIARKYNKRIKVYETSLTQNEFGGNSQTVNLLFTSWAEIVTNGVGYKATDFGLDTFENPVLFNCRYRNDFVYQGRTLHVEYKSKKYIIKGVRNIGVSDLEMQLFCQQVDE